MRKLIIILVLFITLPLMAQRNTDYFGSKAVLDSAGNDTITVIGTDTLISEILSSHRYGGLQFRTAYAGNADDSSDIQIRIQCSNVYEDRSFIDVQTLVSSDTDTGYSEAEQIFRPPTLFFRFFILGNADNDSTLVWLWYTGEGLNLPYR